MNRGMEEQKRKYTLETFKQELAYALDDNLHTRVWQNYVDYLIIGMILLSTVGIFVSTFNCGPVLTQVLWWVDHITWAFFLVEVSLRIWIAPYIDKKYAGFLGRLRYCFSFYGLIDILSTYPYLLQWFIPLPMRWLKILRVLRVLRVARIARYAKSFSLLSTAFRKNKHILSVSLQFLVIVTFTLSLMLFHFEHAAQPEAYANGFMSVMWAFAQYIGDPGDFADTPPVTVAGRIIACVVGILGIAIVAVPAGVIGSGFTDAIEEDKQREKMAKNVTKVLNAFERKLDRITKIQIVKPFMTFIDLMARVSISEADIIRVVKQGNGFRIINLATTIPQEKIGQDALAIEHFPQNTIYGCCIDRGSRITIIAPSNMVDACIGNFAFYLALFGGFNYISREVGEKAPYKSYYLYAENTYEGDERFAAYEADIQRLTSRPDAWGFTLLVSSGANEPTLPTQVHFNIGGPIGDTRMAGEDLFVKDEATYRALYTAVEETLHTQFGYTVDHQQYYDTSKQNVFVRRMHLAEHSNQVILRLEWEKVLWNPNHYAFAKAIAQSIAQTLTPDAPIPTTFPGKAIGFDGYGID